MQFLMDIFDSVTTRASRLRLRSDEQRNPNHLTDSEVEPSLKAVFCASSIPTKPEPSLPCRVVKQKAVERCSGKIASALRHSDTCVSSQASLSSRCRAPSKSHAPPKRSRKTELEALGQDTTENALLDGVAVPSAKTSGSRIPLDAEEESAEVAPSTRPPPCSNKRAPPRTRRSHPIRLLHMVVDDSEHFFVPPPDYFEIIRARACSAQRGCAVLHCFQSRSHTEEEPMSCATPAGRRVLARRVFRRVEGVSYSENPALDQFNYFFFIADRHLFPGGLPKVRLVRHVRPRSVFFELRPLHKPALRFSWTRAEPPSVPAPAFMFSSVPGASLVCGHGRVKSNARFQRRLRRMEAVNEVPEEEEESPKETTRRPHSKRALPIRSRQNLSDFESESEELDSDPHSDISEFTVSSESENSVEPARKAASARTRASQVRS